VRRAGHGSTLFSPITASATTLVRIAPQMTARLCRCSGDLRAASAE